MPKLAPKLAELPIEIPASPTPEAGATPAPAIDLVHLSRQTLGDHGLEQELLGLFARQARDVAARLATPPRADENKWRADLAHTLKGSAAAVGAGAVARAAAAYEDAARAGAPLETLWPALNAALAAADAAIEGLLERV